MTVATHQDNDNDLPLLNVQFKQTTEQALLDMVQQSTSSIHELLKSWS
jgi:hypothetical protein